MNCPNCNLKMTKMPKRKLEKQHNSGIASSKYASVFLYEDAEFYKCAGCKHTLLKPKVEGGI